MHRKFIVDTGKAPRAMGPFSQAVGYGSLLFVSGQIAVDSHTGKLHPGGIESQTRLVMDNLQGVLMGAGLDLSHVLKTTVYLRNLNDLEIFGDVYNLYFDHGAPARTIVEVSRLPQDALVQVDAICAAPADYEALKAEPVEDQTFGDFEEQEFPDYDPAYGDDGTGPAPREDLADTNTVTETPKSADSNVTYIEEPADDIQGPPGTVQAQGETMVGGWSPLNLPNLPPPKKDE
jgi:2-iminobutanoate/2-iminopropanoate deaminase